MRRGDAVLNVNDSLSCIESIRNEYVRFDAGNSEYWSRHDVQERLQTTVRAEIRDNLSRRLKIRSTDAYDSVSTYFKAMTRFGCTVEAVPNKILGQPRVDILVQPDGNTSVDATFDVTFGIKCFVAAAAFPQQSVSDLALYRAARHLGKKLFERGIRGHVSLDFVAYDLDREKVGLWAQSISVSYEDTRSSFQAFRCLTGGRFDAVGGKFSIKDNQGSWSQRTFVAVPNLSHACIGLMKIDELFRQCRMHGVAFDPQIGIGTALMFPGPLATGQIGVISADTKRKRAKSKVIKLFEFLREHVGSGFGKQDFSKDETTSYCETKMAVKNI